MKNTQSLKLNRDFRRAYKGDNFVGGYTVVYMKKNKYQFNRLGLRVGKATGKAVTHKPFQAISRNSLTGRLTDSQTKTADWGRN